MCGAEGSRNGREGGRKEKAGIKGEMICRQMGRLATVKTSVLPKLIYYLSKVISKSNRIIHETRSQCSSGRENEEEEPKQ